MAVIFQKKSFNSRCQNKSKDIENLEKLPFEETREIADKLKLIVDEYDYNKIDISSSKFNTFQRAIKNKQKMEIVYDSLNLGKSYRIINPIEMFLFSLDNKITRAIKTRKTQSENRFSC